MKKSTPRQKIHWAYFLAGMSEKSSPDMPGSENVEYNCRFSSNIKGVAKKLQDFTTV